MHAQRAPDAVAAADARKRLASAKLTTAPAGVLQVIREHPPEAAALVDAYLALGVRVDQPIAQVVDGKPLPPVYPLNFLMQIECGPNSISETFVTVAPLLAKLLIEGGADPTRKDPDMGGESPLMRAVGCPAVLKELLARKPSLATVDDVNQWTVMDHAAIYANANPGGEQAIAMLIAAGYDVRPTRAKLVQAARQNAAAVALIERAAGAARSAAGPPARPTSAVDWRALGPYTPLSAADAKRILSLPSLAMTVDDHFWDGISQKEPYRIAAAVNAGVNVKQTARGTGRTPLVMLTELCDRTLHPDQQSAAAELLVSADADLTGVDSTGANALTKAAGSCPVGVVQALLKAGMAPTVATAKGETPLKNAIDHNRADVVAVLLEAGVDPKKEPYNVGRLASGKKDIEAALKARRK